MSDYTVGFVTGAAFAVLMLVFAQDLQRFIRREIARAEAERLAAALDSAMPQPVEKKAKVVA